MYDSEYGCSLAITKLDILDSFDEVKIGTYYKKNGERIEYYPGKLRYVDFC